jgi:hypothetical protein
MVIGDASAGTKPWAAALIVVGVLASVQHVAAYSRLDDDLLYLYTASFEITDHDTLEREYDATIASVERRGAREKTLARYRFRRDYAHNYMASSVAIAAVRNILAGHRASARNARDYARQVFVEAQLGLGVVKACCLLALALAALYSPRRDIPWIATVALILIVFAGPLPDSHWRVVRDDGLLGALRMPLRALRFLIEPGHEFGPLHQTPRSLATLLLFGIMMLRWSQRRAAGYWLCVFAATIHATYGALMLVMFVGLDVVLSPGSLVRRPVLVPVLVCAAWSLVFGTSFEEFGSYAWVVVPVLGAVAAATFLVSHPGARLLQRLPWIRRLRAAPQVQAETLMLAVAVVLVLVLASIMVLATSGLTRTYIAQELSGRPLALIRVPLLMGLIAVTVTRLPETAVRILRGLTLPLAIVAMGISFWLTPCRSWAEFVPEETTAAIIHPKREASAYLRLACRTDAACRKSWALESHR